MTSSRVFLPLHGGRQDHPLAGSGSTQRYRRRQLRSGPLLWLDSTVRCSLCHHIRQRGTVHIQPVDRSVYHPEHLPREDDRLPPAIKVSPPTQGGTAGEISRTRLVNTPSLGPPRHQNGSTAGRGTIASGSGHGLPTNPSR